YTKVNCFHCNTDKTWQSVNIAFTGTYANS
ncbi:unnamed protein product, partial [marine sediment metagenome]